MVYLKAIRVNDVYIVENPGELNQIKKGEYVYFGNRLQKVIVAEPKATSVVLEYSGLIFEKHKLQRVVGVRYIHHELPLIELADDIVLLEKSISSMCQCRDISQEYSCGFSDGDECRRKDIYGDYWIVGIETTSDNRAVIYQEPKPKEPTVKTSGFSIEDLKNKYNN